MKDIELWLGDCLELMKNIKDKSIDYKNYIKDSVSSFLDDLHSDEIMLNKWNIEFYEEH